MSTPLRFRNNTNIAVAVSQRNIENEAAAQPDIKHNLQLLPELKPKKTSLIVSSFLILLVALFGVLFLKIQITQKQYQIVQARNDFRATQRQGQTLLEEVGALSSPGNLVKQADSLGMIPSSNHLFIDLTTGKVNGELVKIPPAPTPENNLSETESKLAIETNAKPAEPAEIKDNSTVADPDAIPAPVQNN